MSLLIGTLFSVSLALVFLGACFALEWALPRGERVKMADRFPGALLSLLSPVSAVLLSRPLYLALGAIGFRFSVPLSELGLVGGTIVMLLVVDFLAYWRHRFEHTIFWPLHVAHHVPTDLHAANGYQHPLQVIPNFLFIIAPLSLIDTGGFAMPAAVATVFSFMQLFIHSPTRLNFGPLNRLLVDNRFHRIHHSTEPRHFDKNFGINFSIWDQLFGTAYFPKRGEWPAVGLAEVAPPQSAAEFLLLPLRVRIRVPRLRMGGRREAALAAPTSTRDNPRPSADLQS